MRIRVGCTEHTKSKHHFCAAARLDDTPTPLLIRRCKTLDEGVEFTLQGLQLGLRSAQAGFRLAKLFSLVLLAKVVRGNLSFDSGDLDRRCVLYRRVGGLLDGVLYPWKLLDKGIVLPAASLMIVS